MDRRSDTRGYTINVPQCADAACESTVKSRFRDVKTITRTNQAPVRASRVHAITMDPSDTSQNKLIHIANPKFYSGFMQRLAACSRVSWRRRSAADFEAWRVARKIWAAREFVAGVGRCLAAVAAVAVVEKAAVMAGSAAARTRHTHTSHGTGRGVGDGAATVATAVAAPPTAAAGQGAAAAIVRAAAAAATTVAVASEASEASDALPPVERVRDQDER